MLLYLQLGLDTGWIRSSVIEGTAAYARQQDSAYRDGCHRHRQGESDASAVRRLDIDDFDSTHRAFPGIFSRSEHAVRASRRCFPADHSHPSLLRQLFHPFSQENPLQTGTGLGLAIVNSIVRSDSVNGKVDVWSSEGLGTEIKVTLNVEIDEPLDEERSSNVSSADSLFGINVSVALVCFRKDHRGINLSKELISGYATWWGFEVLEKESLTSGDIIMADEDDSILETLLKTKSIGIPVLILSTSRSARQSAALSAFLGAGGFAQMVFKPVGPARLEAALRACVQSLHHDTPSNMTTRSLRSDYFSPRIPPMHPARSPTVSDNSASHRQVLSRQFSSVSTTSSRPSFVRAGTSRQTSTSSAYSGNPFSPTGSEMQTPLSEGSDLPSQLIRRRSVEDHTNRLPPIRPGMAPRSTTYHDTISARQNHPRPIFEEGRRPSLAREEKDGPSVPGSPQSEFSTISLADGGVMLKQAAKPEGVDRERNPRIMLVDDNAINLQLLGAYLKKKVSCDEETRFILCLDND